MSKIILEFTHEEIPQVIEDLQQLATVQTMAQIEERVGKQFSDRIAALQGQIENMGNPKPKEKRWSRKYDACIKCHNSDSPHASRGRCKRCYQADIAAGKVKTIIPLSVRSDHVDTRRKDHI